MWGQECLGCVGVHLTKGHPTQSSTELSHKMSLHRGDGVRSGWVCGGNLTKGHPAKVVPNLATRCLYTGVTGVGGDTGVWGTSDQRSACPKGRPNIKLTKCSITLGH